MENACLFHLQHSSDLSLIVLFRFFFFRISFPPLASHLMPENVANHGARSHRQIATNHFKHSRALSLALRDRCPHPYKCLYHSTTGILKI